ncbi:hypothetical protein GY45DRAFT_140269 [Cubamyces sp. BRFM 1775]|nr:hypothetical protein GY45DRAFT_140269 [Cubamyces sp. BRFM 1775]
MAWRPVALSPSAHRPPGTQLSRRVIFLPRPLPRAAAVLCSQLEFLMCSSASDTAHPVAQRLR